MRILEQDEYDAILRNPNISEKIIDHLLMSKNKFILAALAKNLTLSSQLEMLFKRNKSEEVKLSLCGNSATPSRIIEKLYDDKSTDCKSDCLDNSNLPRELIAPYLQKINPLKEHDEDIYQFKLSKIAEMGSLTTNDLHSL